MVFRFNPFTMKLDMVSAASSITPQSGSGSPEWSIAARYAGDFYINATTGVLYTNPTSWATTGWEVVQTAPAL